MTAKIAKTAALSWPCTDGRECIDGGYYTVMAAAVKAVLE